MAVLSDLGTFLDTATIATVDLVIGTNLFLGRLPQTPDSCVALYETPGVGPGDHFGTAAPALESPGIQVRVRAADYATAQSLAVDVWKSLTTIANQSLSGTRYLRFAASQSPFSLERDDRDRAVFAFNGLAVKAT